MRTVKVEGKDLETLLYAIRETVETARTLELGFDSEGVKVKCLGIWTAGYGSCMDAPTSAD